MELEFPVVFKKNSCEISMGLVFFYFGISKGFYTILQNIQEWKLVFFEVSKGKVANLKTPGWGEGGEGSEKYILNPLRDEPLEAGTPSPIPQ